MKVFEGNKKFNILQIISCKKAKLNFNVSLVYYKIKIHTYMMKLENNLYLKQKIIRIIVLE